MGILKAPPRGQGIMPYGKEKGRMAFPTDPGHTRPPTESKLSADSIPRLEIPKIFNSFKKRVLLGRGIVSDSS